MENNPLHTERVSMNQRRERGKKIIEVNLWGFCFQFLMKRKGKKNTEEEYYSNSCDIE